MKPQNRLLYLIIAGVGLATVFTFSFYNPCRQTELFFKLYGIALLVTFVGYALWSRQTSNPDPMILPTNTRIIRPQPNYNIFLIQITVAALLMDMSIAVNRVFDTSAPISVTRTVTDAYVSHNRRSSAPNYHVAFISPITSPLPFSFSDKDNIPVTETIYSTIIPGRTTITFNIHPGLLGFAWFENHYHLYTP